MKPNQEQLITLATTYGHFTGFAGGTHSNIKLECDNITSDNQALLYAASLIGRRVLQESPECDTILSVGEGANPLASPVAAAVNEGSDYRVEPKITKWVLNEAGEKKFYVPGGGVYLRGSNVVIIDDVLNHGTNTSKVAELISTFGAHICSVVTLFSRNGETQRELVTPHKQLRLSAYSVIALNIPDYSPEECPQCI